MARAVNLFVLDSMADWEPGYAISGINQPRLQKQPGRYVVRTVGLSLEPATTMGGAKIVPDIAISDLDPADSAMLIVPGAMDWDQQPEKLQPVIEVARRFVTAGVPIAGICGATAGFARGGLLDNCRHTSNAKEYLQATGYAGSNHYVDALAVSDKNVVTASVLGALEFAREIFKVLDLYTDEVRETWYKLFKTGDPEFYRALMQKVNIRA